MSTLEKLVTVAARRTEGFDWSILIPVIMELIQAIIEECTNTEAQWIAVATNSGPIRRAVFLARIKAALRRDGRVAPADRTMTAYAIADDLAATAAECDAVLADVYGEVKG